MKKNLIITGASGWLGKSLIKHSIINYKNLFNLYALSSSSKNLIVDESISVESKNFYENLVLDGDSILFHFAFLTKDKLVNMSETQYIDENNKIRLKLVEILKNNKVSSLIYVSSGAAYNNNNLYSDLKIRDEIFFKEFCFKNKINLLLPRLFNIGGYLINKHKDYALSNFILQALENKFIKIESDKLIYRSYIYVNDFLEICLRWVMDDRKIDFFEFDTRGNEIVEMEDLAKIISNFCGNCPIIRPQIKLNIIPDNYFGDISKQKILCLKYGIEIKDVTFIVNETISYLKKEYKYD